MLDLVLIFGFIILVALGLSLILTLKLGLIGALTSCLISGCIAGWLGQALRGVGSPTGNVHSDIHWSLLIEHFLLWFFIGFVVFPGIHFFKLFITKQVITNSFLLAWVIGVGVILLYFVGSNILHNMREVKISLTIGYDKELDFTRKDIDASLVKGDKNEFIPIKSSGGSRKVSKFGYNSWISGTRTIYFSPEILKFRYSGHKPVDVAINKETRDIIVYLKKNNTLDYFFDDKKMGTMEMEFESSQE